MDPSSGEVRVRRMLGIYAAGRIVNPLTARNQLIGGMTLGHLHGPAARRRSGDRNTGATT